MLTMCVMLAGSLAGQVAIEEVAKKYNMALQKLMAEEKRAQQKANATKAKDDDKYFRSVFARKKALMDGVDFSDVFAPVLITRNLIPGRVGMIQDSPTRPALEPLNPQNWGIRAVIKSRLSDTEALIDAIYGRKISTGGGKQQVVSLIVANYPTAAEVEDEQRKKHDENPPPGKLVLLVGLVQVLPSRELNGKKYPVIERIQFDAIKAEIKRQREARQAGARPAAT